MRKVMTGIGLEGLDDDSGDECFYCGLPKDGETDHSDCGVDEIAGGDDNCDLCMSSEVNVGRTTWCGLTIGIECGCDERSDGGCGRPDCACCRIMSVGSEGLVRFSEGLVRFEDAHTERMCSQESGCEVEEVGEVGRFSGGLDPTDSETPGCEVEIINGRRYRVTANVGLRYMPDSEDSAESSSCGYDRPPGATHDLDASESDKSEERRSE